MATLTERIVEYPSKSFKKGQTVLLKDDVPASVYVIEKGYIKAYTITPDGAERQIAIHERGEAVPLGFGIRIIESAPYFYEAYSDCVVRCVPRDKFAELIQQDSEVLYNNYVHLAKRYLLALEQIRALEHPRAGDKVAFMIMNLANQVGTKIRPSNTHFKLAVTQQEIADSLGLTRETTGAELKKLELHKIISYSRKSYVLSMERLRRYLRSR